MDEFVNPVPPDLFRRTNGPWNDLRLNAPWSVGYVTSLIESRPFASPADWEAFYLASGSERRRRLAERSDAERTWLNEYRLGRPERVPAALRYLNFDFGRTTDELADKGRCLHERMHQLGTHLTPEEATACVHFRVIGETWNGVVLRERNAVARLQTYFPAVRFEKTSGAFDHRYAVDYELFCGDGRRLGLQIKPASYATSQAPYLVKARQANAAKNQEYRRTFGCPVFDVIARTDGTLVHPALVEQLRAYVHA
jgi:hypothetical protein